MQSANALGLRVVIITAVAVIAVWGSVVGVRRLFFSDEETIIPEVTPDVVQQVVSQDTDQDGLPDVVEDLYRTDVSLPDTDGDGTNDGDEVVLRRDPTVAGPDDTLPEEFVIGETLALDTYTSRYLAQLPSGASRERTLDKEALEAFVEKERVPLLPELPQGSVQINPETGAEAISTYLDLISSSHNSSLVAVSSADIELAFRQYYTNAEPETLESLIATLESNLVTLQTVSTPKETQDLHEKLLAASSALIDNTKLLQNMPQDFVGGLVGAKNIEELGGVFENIAADILALEEKYVLE